MFNKRGKVMEMECLDEVENIDLVNAVREEWLERVRLRQLEWACRMLCKGLVMKMADMSVDESERRVCIADSVVNG